MSFDDDQVGELDAAKKTIAVLKNRVRALQSGHERSPIQKQLEVARKHEEEGRRKRELLAVRAQELKRYSEVLEAEVETRATAMKTIVDNVAFGFLLVDRNLKLQDGFTKSCRDLFGADVQTGTDVGVLVGASERARRHLQLCVDQVFEDILPEEALLDQLPKRFRIRDERVLAVDPRVVRDPAGAVQSLLLTVSDVTALEQANREARRNGMLVEILRQKAAFVLFIADVKHEIARARAAVHRGEAGVARQAVHTIKGNAACYALDDQVRLIHEVESSGPITAEHLNTIEETFRAFLLDNQEVLGMRYDDERTETFELDARQAEHLRRIAARLSCSEARDLRRWTAEALRRPASQYLGPMRQFATRLGERLGKRVHVVVNGDDTLVDSERLQPVLHTVIHLVRNAVDHGIEEPEARDRKPATGTISVAVRESSADYFIVVTDDGRGIDTRAITSAAQRRGLLSTTKASEISDEQRLDLIYLDDVSTASETTEISGRGAGMSAVREAVRGAGGTIQIETAAGKGTTFTLRIPKPDALRPTQRPSAPLRGEA